MFIIVLVLSCIGNFIRLCTSTTCAQPPNPHFITSPQAAERRIRSPQVKSIFFEPSAFLPLQTDSRRRTDKGAVRQPPQSLKCPRAGWLLAGGNRKIGNEKKNKKNNQRGRRLGQGGRVGGAGLWVAGMKRTVCTL